MPTDTDDPRPEDIEEDTKKSIEKVRQMAAELKRIQEHEKSILKGHPESEKQSGDTGHERNDSSC